MSYKCIAAVGEGLQSRRPSHQRPYSKSIESPIHVAREDDTATHLCSATEGRPRRDCVRRRPLYAVIVVPGFEQHVAKVGIDTARTKGKHDSSPRERLLDGEDGALKSLDATSSGYPSLGCGVEILILDTLAERRYSMPAGRSNGSIKTIRRTQSMLD